MRQLSNLESVIMLVGACLMVAGAALYIFGSQAVAPLVFTPGTVAFALMQYRQKYLGADITIRRLRRIMLTGAVLFVLAALLMAENSYHIIYSLFPRTIDGYTAYVRYVHNNWVVALLVAAVLQLYSTHRISAELSKRGKQEKTREDNAEN